MTFSRLNQIKDNFINEFLFSMKDRVPCGGSKAWSIENAVWRSYVSDQTRRT